MGVSFFQDATLINDKDSVSFLDSRQSVCDHERGTSLQQGLDSLLDK